MWWIGLMAAACSDEAPDSPGGGSAPVGETAPPDSASPDSAAPDSEPGETATDTRDSQPPDSGGDSGDPGDYAPATLTQGGVVTCTDPGARGREGPFFLADGGPDWSAGQAPVEPEEGAPGGRGVSVADFDGDGWLDAVKAVLDGPSQILLSRCGAEGWLEIDLAQPAPNRDALGARIEVAAGERSWTRWITGSNTNFGSMGPLEAHVGLGDLDQIDALTVTWPDGERSRFTDIATRQRLQVTRLAPE